jgi:S-methylmethionine-dependent homocysteine/selenocysteine methylase
VEAAVLFYLTNLVALPQVTDKPILIYPNSGERYDGEKKEWVVSSLSKLKLIHIIIYSRCLLWNMKKQGNI